MLVNLREGGIDFVSASPNKIGMVYVYVSLIKACGLCACSSKLKKVWLVSFRERGVASVPVRPNRQSEVCPLFPSVVVTEVWLLHLSVPVLSYQLQCKRTSFQLLALS